MTIDPKRSDDDAPSFRPTRRHLAGLLSAWPILSASGALAQTDQGATNILRSLAPHDRGQAGARRSAAVSRRVRTRTGSIEIDLSRRVEVTVFFDNDSTALRSGAQQALLRLAAALRDPILANEQFLIAGHTNSVGAYDYNVQLSEERAAAVLSWLVSVGDVESGRLRSHGFGPDMLRNPSSPASPANRRVEVIAITG